MVAAVGFPIHNIFTKMNVSLENTIAALEIPI
jgi:hypothetical protein